MKSRDLLFLFIGAALPYLFTQGFIPLSIFWTSHLIILGFLFVYFFFQGAVHYFYTFKSPTFLKVSNRTERNDIIAGLLWGASIGAYLDVSFPSLLLWLLVGFIIIAIGFLPNTLISEDLGIKISKKGTWTSWTDMKEVILNRDFFGYKDHNGVLHMALVCTEISKENNRMLDSKLQEITSNHNLVLSDGNAELKTFYYAQDFDAGDENTLDDLITNRGDFISFSDKSILLSENKYHAEWSDIGEIDMEDDFIVILNKNGKSEVVITDMEFEAEDWIQLQNYLTERQETLG